MARRISACMLLAAFTLFALASAKAFGDELLGVGASVLGSAASGGLLGLAGSVLGGVFKWLGARQEMESRRLEYEQELKLQELQLRARQEETEQEIQLANTEGSWQALSDSYRADAATAERASPWAANIKTLFRPFLTVLLVALSAWIIWMLLGGALSSRIGADTASALVIYAVQSVVFSASAAVLWWFGDRSISPPKLK